MAMHLRYKNCKPLVEILCDTGEVTTFLVFCCSLKTTLSGFSWPTLYFFRGGRDVFLKFPLAI